MTEDKDPEGEAFRKLQTELRELQDSVLKFSSTTNSKLNGMLFYIDEVLPSEESRVVAPRKTEYGSSFWQVVGLLHGNIEFKTKAELARHVLGDRGKQISRQRLQVILEKIIEEGLAVDPFPKKVKVDVISKK